MNSGLKVFPKNGIIRLFWILHLVLDDLSFLQRGKIRPFTFQRDARHLSLSTHLHIACNEAKFKWQERYLNALIVFEILNKQEIIRYIFLLSVHSS